MSQSRPPTASRRTAVGGMLAATSVLIAGCTPARVAREPGGTGTSDADQDADPDVVLAARMLAAEREMLARVEATLVAHPGIASVLSEARRAHREHVELLTRTGPTPGRRAGSSTRPEVAAHVPAALGDLAAAEDRLRATGSRASFSARSGAFARALASMAAAAAQQAVQLHAAVRGRT